MLSYRRETALQSAL